MWLELERKRPMAARTNLGALLGVLSIATNADAFVHIVRHGESLADIANRVYGAPRLGPCPPAPTFFTGQAGGAAVPALRQGPPAPGHHPAPGGKPGPAT